MEAGIPHEIEPGNDELVIEIGEIVGRQVIESLADCHIYWVPEGIRKWNPEAFSPQVVSIGPFHYGDRRLEDMEAVKERYFRSFVRRSVRASDLVGIERESEELTRRLVGITQRLVGVVRALDGMIRSWYDGPYVRSCDRFLKLILVDAGFILELLIRHSSSLLSPDYPVAVEPRAAAIIRDLILLENQLPFFVIKELYELASPSLPGVPKLLELCFDYFAQFNIYYIPPEAAVNIEHFTDLLRTFRIPPLVDRPKSGYGMVSRLYTPTQLHEAGVRFKRGASRSRLYMKFEKGVLEIPTMVFDDWEEVIARNIIALEQTRYIKDGYFTDYFIFMDLFIRTREDVDLLSDKKIFSNLLSDGNAAVSMIKNLTKGIIWINVKNEFGDLCRSLNEYYEEPLHRQRAQVKRDYFSSPSATASAIFTVGVITVLTLLQTVCSIMQVKGSGKG